MYKRHAIIPMVDWLTYPEETILLGDIDRWMTEYYETGAAWDDWDTWRDEIDRTNTQQLHDRYLYAY